MQKEHMRKKPVQLQLTEYISWLLKKYQEVKKELETRQSYRITNIEYDSSGRAKIKIHIVGTGKEITFTPEELVCDDKMLEGFSRKDVRTITYYACNDLSKPKYKIVTTTLCENLKKMLFGIKEFGVDEISQKTAEEISANRSIISNISPEDAHCVGYVCGSENILREHEEKMKLK